MIPQIVGTLNPPRFYDVQLQVVGALRDLLAAENARGRVERSVEELERAADRFFAGSLLRIDELEDREELLPLVLALDGTLVTASVELCARCKGNPQADFRAISGLAVDYVTGAHLASADQEYVCEPCCEFVESKFKIG